MKKRIKFLVILFLGLFLFSGCTKSFCSLEDINNIKKEIAIKNEAKWDAEAREKFNNELEIENYKVQKTEEEFKKHPQACITLTEGVDEEGAVISPKSWKYAFGKGLMEGLLVYPISAMLIFFTNLFGSNGVGQLFAIALVTIIIRIFIFLLTMKSTMQSQKLQAIQPELMEIQNKIKAATTEAEKQRLSEKMMAIYKKNGINPLSSLLMPFISFPIFMGVWGAVKGTLVLRTGEIFGINLGLNLNTQIFSFNVGAIILFVVMAISQFVTMRLSVWLSNKDAKKRGEYKTKPSSQMNVTYYVMYGMILIAGFALPGAMVIYWIVGALFGIGQTYFIRLINKNKQNKNNTTKSQPINITARVKK